MEKRRKEKRDKDRKPRYTESERAFMAKKRAARFVIPPDVIIDYKNISLLEKFVTDSGKIIPRRITSISGKQGRKLETAIKCARFLGLLGPHGRA